MALTQFHTIWLSNIHRACEKNLLPSRPPGLPAMLYALLHLLSSFRVSAGQEVRKTVHLPLVHAYAKGEQAQGRKKYCVEEEKYTRCHFYLEQHRIEI